MRFTTHFDLLFFILHILHSKVLRDDFICSVIAHASQPYSTVVLIIVVYVFSFVCFDICLDLSALYPCLFSSPSCSLTHLLTIWIHMSQVITMAVNTW